MTLAVQLVLNVALLTFYRGGSRFWRKGFWVARLPGAAGLWLPVWWRSADGPLCHTRVWPAGAEQSMGVRERSEVAQEVQKHTEGVKQEKELKSSPELPLSLQGCPALITYIRSRLCQCLSAHFLFSCCVNAVNNVLVILCMYRDCLLCNTFQC